MSEYDDDERDDRPLALPPTTGPAWRSPEDGKDRGWPDDRYVVEFSLEGEPPEEDSRKPTLAAARARRYLLFQEMARKGWNEIVVTITDSQRPELGDIAEAEEDALRDPRGRDQSRERGRKLSEADRAEIARRYAGGEGIASLAQAFSVSYSTARYNAKER